MTDVVSKIRQSAQILHAKTDELNALIDRVEVALRESSPGVEFWWHPGHGGPVLVERARDDGSGTMFMGGYVLGHARVGGEWCLAVQLVRSAIGTDDDAWHQFVVGDPVSFRHSPRSVRIEAAVLLSDFCDALVVAIDQIIEDVDRATTSANEFLRSR